MHIFEIHLCHRIVYVITVILIPHMLNSRKKQAQKINNKILKKKNIKIKRKILPAMGLELWTFCLADQRPRPLGHNTSLYKLFLSTSIIQLF